MKAKEAKRGKAVMAVALLLALGLVLAGCDNGTTSNNGKDDKKKDETAATIVIPSVKDQAVYDYYTGAPLTGSGKVYLALYENQNQNRDNIEVGSVTNGKLSFTLPAALDSKYLYNIEGTFNPSHIDSYSNPSLTTTVTYTNNLVFTPANSGVNWCEIYSLFYENTSNQYTADLSCRKKNNNVYDEQIVYVYSSGDVTINGTYEEAVVQIGVGTNSGNDNSTTYTTTYNNLKLSKGWNMLYEKYTDTSTGNDSKRDVTYSVTAPSGLQWVFE